MRFFLKRTPSIFAPALLCLLFSFSIKAVASSEIKTLSPNCAQALLKLKPDSTISPHFFDIGGPFSHQQIVIPMDYSKYTQVPSSVLLPEAFTLSIFKKHFKFLGPWTEQRLLAYAAKIVRAFIKKNEFSVSHHNTESDIEFTESTVVQSLLATVRAPIATAFTERSAAFNGPVSERTFLLWKSNPNENVIRSIALNKQYLIQMMSGRVDLTHQFNIDDQFQLLGKMLELYLNSGGKITLEEDVHEASVDFSPTVVSTATVYDFFKDKAFAYVQSFYTKDKNGVVKSLQKLVLFHNGKARKLDLPDEEIKRLFVSKNPGTQYISSDVLNAHFGKMVEDIILANPQSELAQKIIKTPELTAQLIAEVISYKL